MILSNESHNHLEHGADMDICSSRAIKSQLKNELNIPFNGSKMPMSKGTLVRVGPDIGRVVGGRRGKGFKNKGLRGGGA